MTLRKAIKFYNSYLTKEEQRDPYIQRRVRRMIFEDFVTMGKEARMVIFDWSGTARSLKAILNLQK